MRTKLVLTCLLISIFTIVRVQAASFDCSSVKTEAEKLICSDRALSYYDELLNEAYKTALEKASDKEELENDQREWKEKLYKWYEEDVQRMKKDFNDPNYEENPSSLLWRYKERIALIRARYSTFVYTGDGEYDYVGTSTMNEGWEKGKDENGRLSVQMMPGNKLKFQLQLNSRRCNYGKNGGTIATFLDNRRAVYVDADSCKLLFVFDRKLATISSDSCCGSLDQAVFYKKSDTPVFLQDTKSSGK